jgi:hypothetical protein
MEKKAKGEARFIFWQQWLFYSSLLFALFGVILAFFGNNPLFEHYHRMLASIFFHKESFPEDTRVLYTFIMGPMGATIAVTYLLLAYIARYPFRQKERWARNAIIVAFSVWFIIDTTVSLYYGVFFHTLLLHLLISVPQKAMPLIFTWKDFSRNSNKIKFHTPGT